MATSNDPREKAAKMRERFEEIVAQLRGDVPLLTDPKAKALYEVSAEVIDMLEKAFINYENGRDATIKR